MNTRLDSKVSIIDLIRTALHGAGESKGLLFSPHFFMPISRNLWSAFSGHPKRAEEAALGFFRNEGFRADRSHLNFERGYHGLLMDLWTPPHWTKLEYENVPLFMQLQELGSDYLVDQYKRHLKDILPSNLEDHFQNGDQSLGNNLQWSHFDSFHLALELASCLSEDEFHELTDTVIDFELNYLLPGAPDLLVWDKSEKLWFLVEVKGPEDRIQESQRKWLRSNWKQIRSHFLFLSIDVEA